MSEHAAAEEGHKLHGVSPISIPWVVLASLLCGGGLTLLVAWLATFQWIFFVGVIPVFIGALMFLNDRAGLDHA
jgi:Na+/proline symporter